MGAGNQLGQQLVTGNASTTSDAQLLVQAFSDLCSNMGTRLQSLMATTAAAVCKVKTNTCTRKLHDFNIAAFQSGTCNIFDGLIDKACEVIDSYAVSGGKYQLTLGQ